MMRRYTAVLLILLLLNGAIYAQDDEATATPDTALPAVTPDGAAGTAPSLAQTPTLSRPTTVPPAAQADDVAAPDYLLAAAFDLIYPEAIWSRFQLSIPPGQIASATFTAAQAGWSVPPVSIDIRERLAERPSDPGARVQTDFDYLWTLPVENPPRPFEPLLVTWRFTLTNGQTDTLTEELLFRDPRTDWEQASNAAGDVSIALPSGRIGARSLAADLAQVRDLLRETTGTEPLALRLIVYSAALPLDPCRPDADGQPVASGTRSTVTTPCRPATARTLYAAAGYTPVELPAITRQGVLDAGVILLVEAAYAPVWGEASVPAWFREGLRRFYVPGPKIDQREIARSAARTGSLLRSLEARPTDPQRLVLWQAQSYGVVLYMAEQIGLPGLFSVARGLGDGRSLADLYAEAGGGSLTALNAAWGNWVLSEAAASAYAYSPYLPTTPTPSLTPTRTPTATRTFTPTFTPSITPTVTGILTPTPAPTNTFTPTFTPSLTLRPADSVSPPPPAPGLPAGDVSALLPLLAGGLLAVVLLIVIVALALRRRGR